MPNGQNIQTSLALPLYDDLNTVLRRMAVMAGGRLDWQAPNNFAGGALVSNTSLLVFDNVSSTTIRRSAAKIRLQNNGTTVIKWAINTPVSANAYHGILAACASAEDGLGSILALDGFVGQLYLFSVGGVGAASMLIGYENY